RRALPAWRLASARSTRDEEKRPPYRRKRWRQLAATPAAERSTHGRLYAHGRGARAMDGRGSGGRIGRAAEERGSDREASRHVRTDSAVRGSQHRIGRGTTDKAGGSAMQGAGMLEYYRVDG